MLPALSRRQALKLGGAITLAAGASPFVGATAPAASKQVSSAVDMLRPTIRPRQEWAGDLPVGPLVPEDDVRFLLVHHTASSNNYGPDDVANTIRGFHSFHTGPEKGWPDVAYNFFVDRFGTIWEARDGSIDAAIRGDATGGSQGFAMLTALIGDHSVEPISEPAFAALRQLLAWLAERYEINTAPGATVDFVSRGSNKWPTGATVTARTISGHREMSSTQCPGDLAFAALDQQLPQAVTDLRLETVAAQQAPQTTELATETTVAVTAPSTAAASQSSATQSSVTTTTATTSTTQSEQATNDELTAVAPGTSDLNQQRPWRPFAFGGAAMAGLGVAGAAILKRRTRTTQPRSQSR